MIRLYSGCGTRRLTSTTMVFAILVDTTWPIFSFLIALAASAILFLPPRQFPLAENRQHPRAVFSHAAELLQTVGLAHVQLELEPEHLLVHVTQLIAQLVVVDVANFLRLHIPLLRVFPADELGPDGQLVGRQPHRRSGRRAIHAFHFEEDLARANYRHPLLRRALAFTHTGFSRLLRDRLVREQPDPHLAAALDLAPHRDARCFDLPVGHPAALHRLQTEIAECDRRATPG